MDRRRALAQRPASTEEIQCWAHASAKLAACRDTYNDHHTVDVMARVNRLLVAWPTMSSANGDFLEAPETVKATYKKLSAGLNDIKEAAELEAKAIDEAYEALSVLIALRKAPDAQPAPDKRNKRGRGSSPSSLSGTPPPVSVNKITLKLDRHSETPAPSPQPLKGDQKRSKILMKQLPLQQGRKVAFRQPTADSTPENTWILAVITRSLSEKNRYEVQDAEPQDNGEPGLRYTANLKSIIPLPDPDAPASSPSHPNAYPVFKAGSIVLAQYPDTSCFYRAEVTEVIAAPREGRINAAKPAYRLRFEDDEDQVHTVAAQLVVEWPNP